MITEKKTLKEEVGIRFCQFRKAIDKTQQQLADELKIYQSTITNFEQGKTFPNLNYLNHFSGKYGLNINWLVTGKGDLFLKGYRIRKNAPYLIETFPYSQYNMDEQREYSEIFTLMEVPVVEQVVMAKLLETKAILKDEISAYYLKKAEQEKGEDNGTEGNGNGDEA
ncbi:MAG: helix-turn-helix transcriptional regulator [Candidatus Aminicenantes bacterium]|nr:helix-turn-helix transcriptional regulator [Candidatus Aminicenantes bacterium]